MTRAQIVIGVALVAAGWFTHAAVASPSDPSRPLVCDKLAWFESDLQARVGEPEPFTEGLDPRARPAAVTARAERIGERCPGQALGGVDCAEFPCVVVYVRPAQRGACWEQEGDQRDVLAFGSPAYVDASGTVLHLEVEVPQLFVAPPTSYPAAVALQRDLDGALRLRPRIERRVDALLARVEGERGLAPAAP